MSKHYTNQELKEFSDGNYSTNELFIRAKHIATCATCRQNLKEIAPTFFNDETETNLNLKVRHFSDSEIIGFLKAETPLQHRLQMSEHFRFCDSCKAKLYQANPAFLKQTVATYLSKNEELEKNSFFSSFNTLIPIGAMVFLLLVTISYLLFFMPQSNEHYLQAKVTETPVTIEPFTMDTSSNNKAEKPSDANTSNKQASASNKIEEPNFITKPEKTKIKKSEFENKPNLQSQKQVIISNKRSANLQSDCENQNTIVIPYVEKISKNQPTFRWKPISNAIKYTIYISDTAQILIEQADLEKETAYKLKTTLEPNKRYKWKVVATMPDEKTIGSPSIEFELGKTPPKISLKKSKNINETRCLPK